jgi:hypothetical protein
MGRGAEPGTVVITEEEEIFEPAPAPPAPRAPAAPPARELPLHLRMGDEATRRAGETSRELEASRQTLLRYLQEMRVAPAVTGMIERTMWSLHRNVRRLSLLTMGVEEGAGSPRTVDAVMDDVAALWYELCMTPIRAELTKNEGGDAVGAIAELVAAAIVNSIDSYSDVDDEQEEEEEVGREAGSIGAAMSVPDRWASLVPCSEYLTKEKLVPGVMPGEKDANARAMAAEAISASKDLAAGHERENEGRTGASFFTKLVAALEKLLGERGAKTALRVARFVLGVMLASIAGYAAWAYVLSPYLKLSSELKATTEALGRRQAEAALATAKMARHAARAEALERAVSSGTSRVAATLEPLLNHLRLVESGEGTADERMQATLAMIDAHIEDAYTHRFDPKGVAEVAREVMQHWAKLKIGLLATTDEAEIVAKTQLLLRNEASGLLSVFSSAGLEQEIAKLQHSNRGLAMELSRLRADTEFLGIKVSELANDITRLREQHKLTEPLVETATASAMIESSMRSLIGASAASLVMNTVLAPLRLVEKSLLNLVRDIGLPPTAVAAAGWYGRTALSLSMEAANIYVSWLNGSYFIVAARWLGRGIQAAGSVLKAVAAKISVLGDEYVSGLFTRAGMGEIAGAFGLSVKWGFSPAMMLAGEGTEIIGEGISHASMAASAVSGFVAIFGLGKLLVGGVAAAMAAIVASVAIGAAAVVGGVAVVTGVIYLLLRLENPIAVFKGSASMTACLGVKGAVALSYYTHLKVAAIVAHTIKRLLL